MRRRRGRAGRHRVPLAGYDLFRQALSADLEIFDEPDAHWLVMADLLRRAARFEEARQLCSRALKGQISESVGTLIEYELELLERRDRATHRVDEVGSF